MAGGGFGRDLHLATVRHGLQSIMDKIEQNLLHLIDIHQ